MIYMENNLITNANPVNEEAIKSMNTENAIYFNFSYSALKLLGKNLYSNAANAISELVANALDAKAPEVYVYIDMSDKKRSVIEIMDNGSGMDYTDLADKYVWIGRNKRTDADLNSADKKTVMGRKGIGKLAALYLSNKYYILTKKATDNNENKWEVNLSKYKDSDFPRLDKVTESVSLVNKDIWESFSSGTAIKLENVDLRRNGAQKIEGLRRVFSDFYLIDSLKSTIYVSVKTNKNDVVDFKPVEKKIAYKNFYALFDNSNLDIAAKMSKSIAFSWASQYEHIANTPRETKFIDKAPVPTSGKLIYKFEDDTQVEKEYLLTGWIAIHSTIEQKNAVDDNFIRNSVYQPNRLRLYVRNKLAVADYFVISPSTQAMANYIEGEITFDILDDDDLPDIATSSRQDFLDDDRITLLTSIVDPILTKLFALRNKVGKEITDENDKYTEYLLSLEEEKRKAEAEARAKAEAEAQAAQKAKEEAEKRQFEAEQEAKKYHAQSNTIFSTVTEDQKSFSAKTHLVKTNALTIRNGVTTLAKKIGINNYRELGAISVATDKILSALKYSALAKFNIEDEFITEDLFVFCKEYLLNVLSKQYFNLNFSINVDGEYIVRFNPQYVSLMLDNLVSNSLKSNSTEFYLNMQNIDTPSIVVSDNGTGFGGADMNRIFEFGFSNTGGTGIGLYNVESVVKKMHGQIFAENNEPQGAKFVITLP